MKYDLKKPCANCPFLKKGGVKLRHARIDEIADGCTTNPGATFACHLTTEDVEDESGNYDREETPKSQHCAGALVYADKQGDLGMVQMHRIVMRLGLLDPTQLEGYNDVWDDLDQWHNRGAA